MPCTSGSPVRTSRTSSTRKVPVMSTSAALTLISSPHPDERERSALEEEYRREKLKATAVLQRLAQGRFWRQTNNPQYVSFHAQKLARALLVFIKPDEERYDMHDLREGIVGGGANYSDTAMAKQATDAASKLVMQHVQAFQATGDPFVGTMPSPRNRQLNAFGVAVRQLSPGRDLGAGDNHLIIATITYLQVLQPAWRKRPSK